MPSPAAEVDVDDDLVRRLLRAQCPDLVGRELRLMGEGWDNVLYRLGRDLAVRLPRRAMGAVLMANELRWLPRLAEGLPLPTSAPVRAGEPTDAYPWPWAVVPWFPGDTAEATPPRDLASAASQLGAFLAAVHRPAPDDAPRSPFRGVTLRERAPFVHQDLEELGDAVDQDGLLTIWDRVRGAPDWSHAPVWLHGDVHPLNLIVNQGSLSAVVDFGDLCQGDPASDLAVAWMLFPPGGPRERFRAATGVDHATWERARGWAVALGVALANGDERVSTIGHRALHAVLTDTV